MDRILVIQLGRLGDICLSLPTLAGLREKNPEAEISLLGRPRFLKAFREIPYVDEVIEFDSEVHLSPVKSAISKDDVLNEEDVFKIIDESNYSLEKFFKSMGRFSQAIDLSFSSTSTYVLSLVSARKKRGISRDKRGFLDLRDEWSRYIYSVIQTESLNRLHIADLYRKVAGVGDASYKASLGVSKEAKEKFFELIAGFDVGNERVDDANDGTNIAENKYQKLIALQPGASSDEKIWTKEGYEKLLKAWLSFDKDNRFVILGSESESDRFGKDLEAINPKRVINLCGKTEGEILMAGVYASDLLVSPDSGLSHIASLVHTPTMQLFFGPAKPFDTASYQEQAVIFQAALECSPCEYTKLCPTAKCKTIGQPEELAQAGQWLIQGELEKRLEEKTELRLFQDFRIWKGSIKKRESKEYEFELSRLGDPTFNIQDCFRDMLYLLAKYRLAGVSETLGEGGLPDYSIDDRLEKSVSGLEYIYRAADFGLRYSKMLVRSARVQDKKQIIDIGDKLYEVDELLRGISESYPEYRGFLTGYDVKRATVDGEDLENMAQQTKLAFEEMVQDCRIIFDLIQEVVSTSKTRNEKSKSARKSNQKPSNERSINKGEVNA